MHTACGVGSAQRPVFAIAGTFGSCGFQLPFFWDHQSTTHWGHLPHQHETRSSFVPCQTTVPGPAFFAFPFCTGHIPPSLFKNSLQSFRAQPPYRRTETLALVSQSRIIVNIRLSQPHWIDSTDHSPNRNPSHLFDHCIPPPVALLLHLPVFCNLHLQLHLASAATATVHTACLLLSTSNCSLT